MSGMVPRVPLDERRRRDHDEQREVRVRVPAYIAVAAAICTGCGEKPEPRIAPTPTVTDAAQDLRETACEGGFAPTERFLGRARWRSRARELGPVTVIGWRDLDGARQTNRTPVVVKLPVLVEPGRSARIGIALPEGVEGGFVPPRVAAGTSGLLTAPPSAGVQEARVGGCPALPPGAAPDDLPHTAFGLFVSLSQPACAVIQVKAKGEKRVRRELRLGDAVCNLDDRTRFPPECRESGRVDDGELMLCRDRFVVRLRDGGRRVVRVERPGEIGHWSWAAASPDHRTLLAQWSAECEIPVTYFVSAAGGRPRKALPEASSVARGWTTDGRAIVYVRKEPGCGNGPRPGTMLVEPGGRARHLGDAGAQQVPTDLHRSLRPRSVASVRDQLDDLLPR
jgi:hypothetical protein